MVAKTIDPSVQLVVNQVSALVEYYLERQHGAGRPAAELIRDRAALVAGIVEALRAPRSPQP